MTFRIPIKRIHTLLALLAAASLLAGCAATSAERSPREMLRLAVSGLSVPESYRFALIETDPSGAGAARQEEWKGEVRRHDGLRLLTSGAGAAVRIDGSDRYGEDSYNPSALLEGLLDGAASVRLDEARSDGGEAVLLIKPSASFASGLWSKRLRSQAEPSSAARPLQAADMRCELVVDRHRLVPVELTERSRLVFADGGKRVEEERSLRFRFETEP